MSCLVAAVRFHMSWCTHDMHQTKELAKQCRSVSCGIDGAGKCVCKCREIPDTATKQPSLSEEPASNGREDIRQQQSDNSLHKACLNGQGSLSGINEQPVPSKAQVCLSGTATSSN